LLAKAPITFLVQHVEPANPIDALRLRVAVWAFQQIQLIYQ
jgi:hypothetical protein